MHAVILERNKLVGRRVARVFAAAGLGATLVEDPAALGAHLDGAGVICGDAFDGELVAEHARARGIRGVLWTAEPIRRCLKLMAEAPIHHVLARKDFESAPRPWELLLVVRRLLAPETQLPVYAFPHWGGDGGELSVHTPAERDAAIGTLAAVIAKLGMPARLGEMVGEVLHELLMNALYDAPADAQGRPRFAHDRKAPVMLSSAEAARLSYATDGMIFVVAVRDPFGRLERHHVVGGLARGLAGGEQDRSHGGAGLGLTVCHNASSALFFDVEQGRATEATAVFDLDLNLRELRTQAKSLHVWSR
ncbi:MAG TPA: hypothetical protein VGM88_23870 [Kofleriaceae bacterium]|jgi:hypothetical protein